MSDQSAAANLEITSALAEAAEDILRDFAENAELEVALVVDHSGALIAGISADDDVNVDTVGALVAGTIGSIRALGKSVGETKALESMHHGEETTIYLRELNDRFLLVGTAESGLPAGIIREVGSRIAKPLLSVLLGEEIVEKSDDEVVDFKDESDEKVEEPIELTDTSAPESDSAETIPEAQESDAPETKALPVPPMVVDSPFEFVDDEDDFDQDGAEEEEEGIASDGMIFEIGVDEDIDPADTDVDSEAETTPEIETSVTEGKDDPTSEKPDVEVEGNTNSVFQLADEDDDESDVAAPLLVSPMMPTPEQNKIEVDDNEDDSTSVAAITTPIATDIIKKKVISAPSSKKSVPKKPNTPVSEEPPAEEKDTEPDDDEPISGPRYVFEIG